MRFPKLALTYLGRSYRHQVWIQLDHPSLSTLVQLLKHWTNQYLVVRRQFYDTSNLAVASTILGLLERNAAFEWHGTERTGHRSTELQDRMMDPMVDVRIVGHFDISISIWNADVISPGGGISVRALGSIIRDGVYEKLYT